MVDDKINKDLIEKFKKGTFNLERDFKDYLNLNKEYSETDPDFIDFIKDIQKVFQVKLSDVDFNFWVDFSNGKIEYDFKIHPDPNVVILMTKKVLTDFLLEKIDPAIAYMAGKINIIGSVSDALLLGKLLKYSTTKMLE